MYASVIVDISAESLDRTFSYSVPDRFKDRCKPGTKVTVPFGKGGRLLTGYVIECSDHTDFDPDRIKDITDIVVEQNASEGRLIELAAFIKERYGSTMNTALKTVLPIKKTYKPKAKKTIILKASEETAVEELAVAVRKKQAGKERLMRELIEEKVLDYHLVTGKLGVSATTVTNLEKAGVISIETENYFRNPIVIKKSVEKNIELNDEQKAIVKEFIEDYDADIRKTYLLHGITGSGKTVTYIKLIEEVVKRGKQVIVLIPEIALTYQTVKRFYHYFGERVSIMNSTLSEGEKYDQCERAKKGEIDVIIGPRSALFTPFERVGLIVMDEEHEHTYKSENVPKYHAREVAEKLAELNHASVVLGSATPSVDTFYRAVNGEYRLWSMYKRAVGGRLAGTSIVDMREELKKGNKSVFSEKLKESIAQKLDRNEQVMLFLNRRGYAGFVSCRSCGIVLRCPHCDVSLSEHRSTGKMVCHYCGYEEKRPSVCPKCGSKYILGFKAGTELIEEEVKKIFPAARTLRMDADTTKKKGSLEHILSEFGDRKADILIGTQMIVKGHDFPDVTLVGIIAADMSLAINDYRAAERTFQLITQAAGRAGRGTKEGETVIQTYQPEHYAIVRAAAQDYRAFYDEEILYRELGGYPPICDILAVLVTSRSRELAENTCTSMAEYIKGVSDKVKVIGPAKAGIGKINDVFRFVFFIKSRDERLLTECKNRLESGIKEMGDLQVFFDLNPMNPY
ncbi:MAG: primosomal protein N' [Lachnospiraceae bacterium]|nr:primosomal protein N' [Lachnospiraceae bacterium]